MAPWQALHCLVWTTNLVGLLLVLAGHEHYTIDVIMAYFVTSRLFAVYHASAALLAVGSHRYTTWCAPS